MSPVDFLVGRLVYFSSGCCFMFVFPVFLLSTGKKRKKSGQFPCKKTSMELPPLLQLLKPPQCKLHEGCWFSDVCRSVKQGVAV